MLSTVQVKRLRSHDGTELCYYTAGKGPAVVLANGLGASLGCYRHLVKQLAPDYTLVSWDYRGTFHSQRPGNLQSLGMVDQIRDLEAILAAEGIDEAIVLGWSMGVQVALEFYRSHRQSVAGLVLLCGVAGTPFRSMGVPLSGWMGPPLVELGRRSPRAVRFLANRMTRWPGFVPLMQRVGMVAGTLDMAVFQEIAIEYASVDVEVYCETLQQLGRHDAHESLADIEVPTLVIAGARDRLTPSKAARRMHEQIPNSRLRVVPNGTHYTPMEYPERVAHELEAFLRDVVGYEPPACRQSYS